MKKVIIFVTIIIFLGTFNYHLGKIPIVAMYANQYVYQYFSNGQLDLERTKSPVIAKALILFGADVNAADSSNRRRNQSPLYKQIKFYNDCAYHRSDHGTVSLDECQNNYLQIIEVLLDNGAQLNEAAFNTRHVPILELLVKAGLDIEKPNRSGESLLFYQTQYMFKHNSHDRSDLDTKAFEYLISIGANIHVKDKQEKSLLHVARFSETIASLVAKGLDVNAQDKFGNTPIFYRVKDLDEPMPVKTLMESGADLNITNAKGQTVLEFMLLAKNYPNKNNKNAAYLLKKGASVNPNIYVNALHIKKPKRLADSAMQKTMMQKYKDINHNDEYGVYMVMHKMRLAPSGNDFDQWKTMEYIINLAFIDKVIASYTQDIAHIQNTLGNSPLHYVVEHSAKLTAYFIQKGVDVNALNKRGQPALFFCKNIETANLLIDAGANISIQDTQHKSALNYIQNPELLSYLVSKGLSVEAKDTNTQSPLASYVKKSSSYIRTASDGLKFDTHYKTIKVFLDNGADINEKLPYTDDTILFLVNDAKLLDKLIESGINVEAKNKAGQTALFQLVRFPRVKIGKMLIEKGANVKVLDNEKNTLLHFVYDGELAEIIIDKGVDVNSKNKIGDTPLHVLVRANLTFSAEGKHKTYEVFLKKGADINRKNNKGMTPLMAAIAQNNKVYIRKLLDSGADIMAKDNEGNTILHYAARNTRNLDFMKQVLEIGSDIDINTQNKRGLTMLDKVYQQDVKNYLIDEGAKFGKTKR